MVVVKAGLRTKSNKAEKKCISKLLYNQEVMALRSNLTQGY